MHNLEKPEQHYKQNWEDMCHLIITLEGHCNPDSVMQCNEKMRRKEIECLELGAALCGQSLIS